MLGLTSWIASGRSTAFSPARQPAATTAQRCSSGTAFETKTTWLKLVHPPRPKSVELLSAEPNHRRGRSSLTSASANSSGTDCRYAGSSGPIGHRLGFHRKKKSFVCLYCQYICMSLLQCLVLVTSSFPQFSQLIKIPRSLGPQLSHAATVSSSNSPIFCVFFQYMQNHL